MTPSVSVVDGEVAEHSSRTQMGACSGSGGQPARGPNAHYTYGDYRAWPDGERWELIDGVLYDMSPAPSRMLQSVAFEIVRQIAPQLESLPCAAYFAPFDVRLPKADETGVVVDTVVQPDFLIVCDSGKLDDAGMRGAPDFLIEILSPSTLPKDVRIKTALYERHGGARVLGGTPHRRGGLWFPPRKTGRREHGAYRADRPPP